MSVWLVLWVIVAHWFADFVCQTHSMATLKSKEWSWLMFHVCVYTLVMGILVGSVLSPASAWQFVGVTFAAHFCTDVVTSRITSRLYAKGDYHNFFVVIGFDQVFHYAQLFLTLAWLMS